MFNDHKSTRYVYCLIGVLGLCCTVWLILNLMNVGNTPMNQTQRESKQQEPTISRESSEHSIQTGFDQSESSLEEVEGINDSNQNLSLAHCSARCDSTLSMLDGDVELDDNIFSKLEANIPDIANHLKSDASKRHHYTQIALTTTDGDKRAFLANIFKHLPYQQAIEIGTTFINSESWQVRVDGIELITHDSASGIEVANSLMEIFSNDENAHVKGTILNNLKHSPELQGDTEILQQLDSAIYSETDSSVRVAAFKAKAKLSAETYHILPDALQALRTNDPELQFASLTAIDKILKHEKEYNEDGVYIDRDTIKSEFEIIQNLTVYDDNERYDRLIREAHSIYSRYFES